MLPPIPPDDLAKLIDEAAVAALRLQRKLALPSADLDDLRQDLLVDLICRLPGFDARRGTIGAFANIVLRNQSSRIALRHHRERRMRGGSMLSLEVPLAGAQEPVGDILTEDDGLSAWYGQPTCTHLAFERRHALHSAVSQLSSDQRALCQALAHRPVAALVAEGFASRSSLYRHLADLRHVLTAYGIGPAWDDFAAA